MKQISKYLSNKIKNDSYLKDVIIATNKTIYKIVKNELDRLGHCADLNHIDVSQVTDMNNLFNVWCNDVTLGMGYEDLNPDISKWDVSKVKNMSMMFYGCENFNCDISNWDVSNVKDNTDMFVGCSINPKFEPNFKC